MTRDSECDVCGLPWCISLSGEQPCPRLAIMSTMPKREWGTRKVPRVETSATISTLPHNLPQDRNELKTVLTEYMDDEFFAGVFADCIDLIKKKNADYTEGAAERDRIAHFREAAQDLELPMTKIWQVFVRKHWAAVRKFANGKHLESEPIEGRVHDIINYMVLLRAIIEDGKTGGS